MRKQRKERKKKNVIILTKQGDIHKRGENGNKKKEKTYTEREDKKKEIKLYCFAYCEKVL